MNAKTTGMTEGSIMAAIITVHMTRNGRRAIPWQVGMSALAAGPTQAGAARRARRPGARSARLALVASAHLRSTTVQQRPAAERIASKDVGPAVQPIGSALVQPCVVSLMVAARHRFWPAQPVIPASLTANLMSGVPVTE